MTLAAQYEQQRRCVAGFIAINRPDLARIHIARAVAILDQLDAHAR